VEIIFVSYYSKSSCPVLWMMRNWWRWHDLCLPCESDMVYYVCCDVGVEVSPSCCDMHLRALTWQQPQRNTAVCPTKQTPNYKHCLSHRERQSAKEMRGGDEREQKERVAESKTLQRLRKMKQRD